MAPRFTTVTASKRVADELRGLMGKARVTQAELGAVLGISQAAVGRRLAGRVAFTVDEVELIAAHFHVKTASLLGEAA